MTPITRPQTRGQQIFRAQQILRSLGHKCAAKYLKNRGWSCEATMWILFRK